MNNLVGEKFGKLLVLNLRGRNEYRQMVWECQCECGRLTEVPSHNLTNGNTKSCGQCREKHSTRLDKLLRAGYISGSLLILHDYDSSKDDAGYRLYQCVCRCGNPDIIWVRSTDLLKGRKTSCGACPSRLDVVYISSAVRRSYDSVASMIDAILQTRPDCRAIYAEETGEVLWVKDKDISDWGVYSFPNSRDKTHD